MSLWTFLNGGDSLGRINQWFTRFKTHIKQLDLLLVLVYIVLSLIGLVVIYSASMVPSQRLLDATPDHYLIRQLIFVTLGLIIIAIIYNFIRPSLLQSSNFQMVMVLFSIFIILYTFFFGTEVNGEKNWIYFGSMGIQPSEFVKIVVILYLAQVFHSRRNNLSSIDQFYGPAVVIVILTASVVFQDFGTGAIIIAIVGAIIMFSGIPFKYIASIIGAGAAAIAAILGVNYLRTGQLLDTYQMGRIQTFLNPFEDPLFQGYQITNSLIAISRGGFTGSGIGDGIMKLGYLPEAHTDFIFAVLAEEFGLIGVLTVIGLFMILVFKLLFYALRTQVMFYRIVLAGVAIYFAAQIFLNLGGISKVIPLTGVPLPLISAGGSSYLSFSIAFGIALVIIKEIRKHELK
ncbi:cell division-specific peptidoglycan biosynthesis regulator FtsW [Aliicoccus persicus]|uniref:Probable peptidoglycan glycosyltransferase FtsW n=1 Tax=Aliicoccus persicus TaxID=930138 RepID=A0A662Z052_9STAP|nr:cell division-specific peptidoglycan biosynthesis regulator FtsW [Aliicoccus persicus]